MKGISLWVSAGLLLAAGILVPARISSVSRAELQAAVDKKGFSLESIGQERISEKRLYLGGLYLKSAGKPSSQELRQGTSLINRPGDWYVEFGYKEPAMSGVLDRKSRESLYSLLGPASRDFFDKLLSWQKERVSRLLLPAQSPSGQVTSGLLLLLSVFKDSGDLTPVLQTDLDKAMAEAPAGSWGRLEKPILGLLVIARRMPLDGAGAAFRASGSLDDLEKLAAFIQNSGEVGTWAMLLDQTPPERLADLFLYAGLWHEKGLEGLSDAFADFGPSGYFRLLGSRKSIRTGWEEAVFPPRLFAAITRTCAVHHEGALLLRLGLFFLGCLALAVACLWPGDSNGLPLNIWMMRCCAAMATAFMLFISAEDMYYFTEPIKPELNFHADASQASITVQGGIFQSMNQLSFFFIGLFFAIQFLVFLWGRAQVLSIARMEERTETKLKFLDNEDILFDLGLYIGLAGNVFSLVLLTMGVINPGLVAAYTSTGFGIIETVVLRLAYARPLKRALIKQQSLEGMRA